MSRAPSTFIALPTLLTSVSEELLGLVNCAVDLQDGLGDLTTGLSPACIEQLQGLDLLTQRLSALAAFLTDAAACVPEDCRPDLAAALQAIPLTSLRDRLTARSGTTPDRSGRLELF